MSTGIIPSEPSGSTSVFHFDGIEIRIVRDDRGEPQFVAADVCKALELANISEALKALDDDETRDISIPDLTGRRQDVRAVTESGLYHLIFKSRKKRAAAFRRWVTDEVLPSVMRTGQYAQPTAAMTPAQLILAQAQMLVAAEERMNRIQEEQSKIEERVRVVEATADAIQHGSQYYTAAAYARIKKVSLGDGTLSKVGRFAAKFSRENNMDIGWVHDARFGRINTYHRRALEYALKKIAIQWPLPEGG